METTKKVRNIEERTTVLMEMTRNDRPPKVVTMVQVHILKSISITNQLMIPTLSMTTRSQS